MFGSLQQTIGVGNVSERRRRLEKPLCYCGVVRPSSAARPKDDKAPK